MKAFLVPLLAAPVLCAAAPGAPAPAADPETVLVTYHVKAGGEAALRAVLARAWGLYRAEGLVFAEPHVIVRSDEEGGKARLMEIFTWRSADVPDHAPASVQAVWKEEQALCEARGGRPGIEEGEVELVAPAGK